MKFIFLLFIFSISFQNLSAYEQISIQKTNKLNNYEDLLKAINSSISVNDVSDLIENNIYNINLSSSKITFDIDINQLSDDLYKNNYKFNLLLLECSLNENFFKFNQNLEECPNFKLISFNQKKYIYLNYLDSYFRIKEFSLNEKLNDIWINFFEKKNKFL